MFDVNQISVGLTDKLRNEINSKMVDFFNKGHQRFRISGTNPLLGIPPEQKIQTNLSDDLLEQLKTELEDGGYLVEVSVYKGKWLTVSRQGV